MVEAREKLGLTSGTMSMVSIVSLLTAVVAGGHWYWVMVVAVIQVSR